MTDREWADTPEGVAAFEWVENYVDEVLQALDDGRREAARRLTAPGVVADGLLGGAGVGEFVMLRTLELAQEAHDCLNSRPVNEYGAGSAIRAIGRLWGVHS